MRAQTSDGFEAENHHAAMSTSLGAPKARVRCRRGNWGISPRGTEGRPEQQKDCSKFCSLHWGRATIGSGLLQATKP